MPHGPGSVAPPPHRPGVPVIAVVVAVGAAAAAMPLAWPMAGVVGLLVLVSAGATTYAVRRHRRRRRRELLVRFAVALRAAAGPAQIATPLLDRDAIRTIRDTYGELHAVRAVQMALPMLSVEQQVNLVRSL